MQTFNIIWRVVPQYSRYEVSNNGLVRARFACDRHPANYILRPTSQKRHAYQVYRVINDNGKRQWVYLHCLVIRAFHGEKPFKGAVTRHLDGDHSNNCPTNLAWGTVKENIQDSLKHGTHVSIKSKKATSASLSTH